MKELLVVSQDTSAYGVDVKYRTGFWDGQPVQDAHARPVRAARRPGRTARRLGAAALRLSVPACRRGAAADGRGPRAALPRRAVPALAPRRAEAHEAPGQRREEPRAPAALARAVPAARACAAPSSPASPARPRPSSSTCCDFIEEARIDRAGCFAYSPVEGAAANELPGMLPAEVREERRARFMAVAEAVSAAKLQRRVGATMQVLVDRRRRSAARAGSAAATPMRRRSTARVRLLPPEKASKTLKVGEFTRARIVADRGPRPGRPAALSEPDEGRRQPTARADPPPVPAAGRLRRAPPVGVHKASTVIFPNIAALRARDWQQQARLHLRPARHADHLHARRAHRHARRRRALRCSCPAAWRRSRWSTSRC